MPIFCFDIQDGSSHPCTLIRLDLPDVATARREACVTATEIAKDRFVDGASGQIDVCVRTDAGVDVLKAILRLDVV